MSVNNENKTSIVSFQGTMFFLIIGRYPDCQCYHNHMFPLRGRRPKTTLISQGTKTLINTHILPFIGKLDLVFQVTDTHTVTRHRIPSFCPTRQVLVMSFVWKLKIAVSTSRILVPVRSRLVISVDQDYVTSGGIELFDGPGKRSDKITRILPEMQLSSYQAFVVVFSNNLMSKGALNSWEKYRLDYKPYPIKPRKVVVPVGRSMSLPQCTPRFHENVPQEQGHCVNTNCHCVYNIFSWSGFVNVSFKHITFRGPDIPDTYRLELHERWRFYRRDCIYGGVGYEARKPLPIEKLFRLETHMQLLCENYTSHLRRRGFDNSLMSIVSSSQGTLLVVSSYKHYSDLVVDIEVSETPCKGMPYYKSKAHTLSQIL